MRIWISTLPLVAIALLVTSCTSEEVDVRASALDPCPDGIFPGAPCDAWDELYCEIGDEAIVCRCDREESSDGTLRGEGAIVCEHTTGTPPPVPICEDHVRTGERCDPSGPAECSHACDRDVTCRCVPSADTGAPGSDGDPGMPGSDGEPCVHVWLCDGTTPPGPGTGEVCTDEHIRACEAGEYIECFDSADGRLCRCSPDAGFYCEPIDPGGIERCRPDLIELCYAGIVRECVMDDGRLCRCDPSRSDGFFCDEPPPPLPSCDDTATDRCGSGTDVACVLADGTVCYCDPSRPGGFVCDAPPPPGLPPCGMTGTDLCSSGTDGRCVAPDGRICWCDPSRPDGFVCEGGTGGGGPPPCDLSMTDLCRGGMTTECVFDGRLCRCTADGGLYCEPPPPPPPPPSSEECTDMHFALCRAGEPVRCVVAGAVCSCNLDGSASGGILCR